MKYQHDSLTLMSFKCTTVSQVCHRHTVVKKAFILAHQIGNSADFTHVRYEGYSSINASSSITFFIYVLKQNEKKNPNYSPSLKWHQT